MTKFSHIIGALLKNIIHARQQSDKYAQELAQKYRMQEDLQLFPIPRTEIDSLQLQVNFVIEQPQIAQGLTDEHINAVRELFRTYTVIINGQWFGFINQVLQHILNSNFSELAVQANLSLAEAQQAILDFLNQNIYSIIEYTIANKPLPHPDYADNLNGYMLGAVLEIMRKKTSGSEDGAMAWWKGYAETVEWLGKEQNTLEALAKVEPTTAALMNDIKLLFAQSMIGNLTVSSEGEKLKPLAKEVVSSIKIGADVQNYVWSEVTNDAGAISEILIPE